MTFYFVFYSLLLTFQLFAFTRDSSDEYNNAKSKKHIKFAPLYPPIQCFTDASQFAMISLLSPGVILFIFIIWLMMPPADIKTVGSRIISTDQKIHSHT